MAIFHEVALGVRRIVRGGLTLAVLAAIIPLIGGAAAACAVCCAPPLLALLGIAITGAAATVASLLFAGVVFAVVVAALSVAAFLARRNGWPRRARVSESRHDGDSLPDPVRPGGDR